MPAGQLIAERDSDGTLIKYLCGPGGIPLQIRVTRTVGGTATTSKYFYQLDHAGSVVALTDEWGSAVARYAYDPWGRPVGGISGTDAWLQARQPLRYRGYCWDAETGMYYLPARYYDPGLARFISPDPAPADASDPLSLNAYAYCVDDPVNRTDRSGATDEDWWEDPVQLRNLQLGVYNTGPGGSVVLPRRWGRRVRRLHQAEFRQRHPQRATFRQRHPQAGPALIDPALSMGWRSPDPLCGSGVGSAGVEHTLRPESGDVGMFWVSQVERPGFHVGSIDWTPPLAQRSAHCSSGAPAGALADSFCRCVSS